jgi:hypothetical protein
LASSHFAQTTDKQQKMPYLTIGIKFGFSPFCPTKGKLQKVPDLTIGIKCGFFQWIIVTKIVCCITPNLATF